MNFQLSTACVFLQLALVYSARVVISDATNETDATEVNLSPEAFQHQIDTFVKPLYNSYPKEECPFFAEGTVVLYCMARDSYKEKLGKAAPGDIDFGHFCRGGSQETIERLGQYVKAPEGGQVKVHVGMIKVTDGERPLEKIDKIALDIHQHHLQFGRNARKRTAEYCLCNNVEDNGCHDVPLAPLDDLKELYTEHHRSSKNDGAKVAFINDLMARNDFSSCGPCTAVPLPGRNGGARAKPKPGPVVKDPKAILQDKLKATNDALRRAQTKKAKAQDALLAGKAQLDAANLEITHLEAEVARLQKEITNA